MRAIMIIFVVTLAFFQIAFSQDAEEEQLRAGINFIEVKQCEPAQNEKLLKLYRGLRVADVSDGMDMVGLPGTGLVDPSIHASWRDLDSLKHQFCGIALTLRYVPTQRANLPEDGENFQEWESDWYGKLSSESFLKIVTPGTAIVIDDAEFRDIGSIGSNNILSWYKAGATGVVTDAASRDVDEVGKQKIPLYLRKTGRGIRPGRNELESVNRPVVIGGVLVCPGDMVVADGDGVVVVPRAVAEQVALYARRILVDDKEGRRKKYEELGIPLDDTVK